MSENSNVQSMAIGKGKARLQTTVSQEVKDIVDALAEKDKRTTSNYLEVIVEEWLRDRGHLPKD